MVSIIIPVLNEERKVRGILEQVTLLGGEKEIIIVDGGSTDNTVAIASKYGRVIHSEKGRSKQMNSGAKESNGDILWFVHSDSIINVEALSAIEESIKSGYTGGGFSLYFYDYDTIFMKFVAATSNIRAKYLGIYFGDQGIFVRKDVFLELGGYPNIELMEDWELSKRLFKSGKIKILSIPIGTSARRFQNGGQLRTLLFMHKIKLLYVLGVPPSKLSKMYREVR
ncbi:TIGR04283 family arsenosugar biosynthesis glycosyltransferase [Serpentinicella alkaliphila]|uniref:4,4'-diaponeurosporenoate glycosyltransferase n=1 Tax=Serpentinicella alkaliphila TaxID=1734049 RepID=A0A4R2TY41_9FIRM|nr:TIGR04283 family arsenosugar biosynthesis glycosyltransferase [Serpentinicella alkaliphila]QUH24594.1 TIGR04283 family arsenosugar biosynthesis glycosyltransferase [Serpentinicella alkaliphila]TCQ02589.1 rSAM/selenodomain-associated transferase 2 [Serpentinicella alkaliphila]